MALPSRQGPPIISEADRWGGGSPLKVVRPGIEHQARGATHPDSRTVRDFAGIILRLAEPSGARVAKEGAMTGAECSGAFALLWSSK